MLNQRDIITNSIKITNDKEVSIIYNNNEDYLFSALTCDGGAVFKKGISIGMQEKMVPGLMIYDNENFYGYSEKNGLSLLSTHQEYVQLDIPDNVFDNIEKIQPIQKNSSENFKNMVDTKSENKNLNIDIEIKDTNNFYILIPDNYNSNKTIITFNITYIYTLDSIISNISLVFINKSNKPLFFKINNKNCYYENNFQNEIIKNCIYKLNLEVVNEDYFLVNNKIFNI
jgi:hypothetical protein